VAFAFSLGYIYGFKGYVTNIQKFPKVTIDREMPSDKKDLNFSLFWRVWDTVHVKYYDKDKIIDSEMVYGAIRGMVSAIGDPYTIFLPPEENKVVQEDLQGSFEGVGIQIGFKGNQLAVMSPLPKSPAEAAGVKAGDFIIGIKDDSRNIDMGTSGISLPEAVQAIRGPAGTKVTLVLLREGEDEPLEIDVQREAINLPSIVVEYVGDGESIAHVQVLKFSGETLTEWEKEIVELLKRPDLKGVIVDVRNNPGGYLQGSVELASDFLESGDVVTIEEVGNGVRSEYRVEKLGRLRNIKTVVLVNGGSASASEIFAGALKDHDRALLVGETTFGKGTIQEPQQINDGTGLHITIARWLTPSGFWVDEGGLKPDKEIEDNVETDEDEQLQEAINVVSSD
jgi:carboxyl-terminal processing protease